MNRKAQNNVFALVDFIFVRGRKSIKYFELFFRPAGLIIRNSLNFVWIFPELCDQTVDFKALQNCVR